MLDLDVIWVVGCSGLVLLMQPGFMCLESGLTRSKNSINVAIKNLADLGLSICFFWFFGFALMFGTSLFGWIGGSGFFLSVESDPKLAAFFIFQMLFCGTATTITSGALAERLKFRGYLAIAMLISGLVYPLFGHWVWNGAHTGTPTGWLEQLGFVDFAGASVVHSIGGWVSLAALLVIGPRTGRLVVDTPATDRPTDRPVHSQPLRRQKLRKIHGSNLPFSVLGTMLLWVGWLGFNGGSTYALNDQIPSIVVHTVLAGAAGMIAATLAGWQKRRVIEAETLINGSLAGLVSITASCHAVSTPMAVLIGAMGGLIMLTATHCLEYYGIDDGVGAVALHGFAGTWGTLALALFGDLDLLGTGLSRHAQLLVQILGSGTAFVWGFGITYIILRNINRICPLRVTVEEEEIGLNVSEHEAKTEVYDLFQVMDQQAKTQDFSLRVPEEPFTEVGKIARRYNQVMASLETYAHQLENLNTNLEQTVVERTAELTHTNAELEKANAELKRLDKLKDEFLANTSHELRTPLNSIIGLSEFLIEWELGPLPEQVSDNLNMISSSGRRLYNLVSDILDFSKILHDNLSLNLKPVGLREITEIVLALCGPLSGPKNLHLINNIFPDLPLLRADEDRLQQILYNLVGNAVKFTENGQIEVSAEADPQAPGQVIVTVADTGIGIPEQKYDSIFESFVQGDGTTAREYGGMGLGLAITKKLVELHGGRIWVESTVGQGTQFHFTLPLSPQSETIRSFKTPDVFVLPPIADSLSSREDSEVLTSPLPTTLSTKIFKDDAEVAVETAQVSNNDDWHQTCKVLIVDDDPVNLRVLENYLSLSQYQVTQASSGPDALSLITPDYQPDLIILDVMMPRMTGYEVTQTLRQKWQRDELPIVLLTAKNQLKDEVTGFKVGANDYLTKPVIKETLLARIETQLALRRESLERQQAEVERIQSETANLAKSTFLAHMSHELRTPLNSIIGFAQLLNRDRFLQAEQRQRVGIINHSAEHLLSLINDILDISKIEAGKVILNEQEFDLHSLLKQVLTMFEPRASHKGLTLTLVQDPQLMQFAVIDEVKLRQILINLIANSLKFTEQGHITLTVSPADKEKMISFEIQDTGPGIAEDELESLFTPFDQTTTGQSIGQGTGLGLSICQRYAQLMRGDISVRSTVGEGSCFTVQVPMRPGSALVTHRRIDRMVIGLAPSQPEYRLLVVDELIENLQLLLELCCAVGFAVKTARNGVEAVEQWQSWQPHLIWMDLHMPEVDGFEATRQIRAASADASQPTVIIALTANVLKETQEEILASGFDGFVAKPFHESVIWSTLSQYLGVEFLYGDLPEASVDGHMIMPADLALTSDMLADFPIEWLRELHQAAARLKGKEVLALIEQLPPDYRERADSFKDLAEDYEFAKIVELLAPLVSESNS